MICCNYIGHDENTVTYAYGGYPADITGEIVFARDGSYFEIIKEPEKDQVYLRSIKMLYSKYRADFAKGVFKEKISFESC